jgi:hypothetical protein
MDASTTDMTKKGKMYRPENQETTSQVSLYNFYKAPAFKVLMDVTIITDSQDFQLEVEEARTMAVM